MDGANSANSASSESGDKRRDGKYPRERTSFPARDGSTESDKRAATPMYLEEQEEGHHGDSRDSGGKGQIGISSDQVRQRVLRYRCMFSSAASFPCCAALHNISDGPLAP